MKLKPTWFILRREPYYHKLQYSKAPKFDVAAAVFGVAVGAFAVYLTLASVGSAGTDLSDLTCLVWYCFILLYCVKLWIFLQKTSAAGWVPGAHVWSQLCAELGSWAASLFYTTKHKPAPLSAIFKKSKVAKAWYRAIKCFLNKETGPLANKNHGVP